jgi:hypothetical protein
LTKLGGAGDQNKKELLQSTNSNRKQAKKLHSSVSGCPKLICTAPKRIQQSEYELRKKQCLESRTDPYSMGLVDPDPVPDPAKIVTKNRTKTT